VPVRSSAGLTAKYHRPVDLSTIGRISTSRCRVRRARAGSRPPSTGSRPLGQRHLSGTRNARADVVADPLCAQSALLAGKDVEATSDQSLMPCVISTVSCSAWLVAATRPIAGWPSASEVRVQLHHGGCAELPFRAVHLDFVIAPGRALLQRIVRKQSEKKIKASKQTPAEEITATALEIKIHA